MREERDRPAAPPPPRSRRRRARGRSPRPEAALVAEDRHQEAVHVPARREQPVDEQQPGEARRLQQVPGVRRRSASASRRRAPRRGTRRAQTRLASGSSASTAKARRKPLRSISTPASTGPTTFESAGARPSQLKMRLSSVASCAIRPAERWIAIRPKFAPAPVSDRRRRRGTTKLARPETGRERRRRCRRPRSGRPRPGSAGDSRAGRRAGRR